MSDGRELEFHDSDLLGVCQEGDSVVLELDGYVYQTEKVNGRLVDSGWMQPLRIVISNAKVKQSRRGNYRCIADGELRLGDRVFSNLVPLPFEGIGASELTLEIMGEKLIVVGDSVKIEDTGEPRFVEILTPP